MPRSADIWLSFGTEERAFRLGIGEWRRVQERCDAGPGELLGRLAPMFEAVRLDLQFEQAAAAGVLGRWRVDDVRAPILEGLIGGGMKPAAAAELVRTWVDDRPLIETVPVAYKAVLASFVGAPDEEAAGAPAEGERAGG